MLTAWNTLTSTVFASAASPVIAHRSQTANSSLPRSAVTASTPLPISNFGDMVADYNNQHVFVSGQDEVLVLDHAGNVVKTFVGLTGAGAMVLNGTTLYVLLDAASGGIERIDTTGLTDLGPLTSSILASPTELQLQAGALWTNPLVTNQYGSTRDLYRVDPSNGSVTVAQTSNGTPEGSMRADPDNSDWLLASDFSQYSISFGAFLRVSGGCTCRTADFAPGPTGQTMVVASSNSPGFIEVSYRDQNPNGTIYHGPSNGSAVQTTDQGGGMIAGGGDGTDPSAPSVWVYGYDQPGVLIFSGLIGARVPPRGLQFSSDGQLLFAVSYAPSCVPGCAATFTAIQLTRPLDVNRIEPTRGPAAGGTSVTVSGDRFFAGTGNCQVTAVHFGTTPAGPVTYCTDTFLTVLSPPGWPSSPDVTVTTSEGTSLAATSDEFTYEPTAVSVVSTAQHQLASSDGATWQPLDPTNLAFELAPPADSIATVMANADLWTAAAGYNQDIGVMVEDDGAAGVLVGWKESGGAGGTFSPNAAYLEVPYTLHAGHVYRFTVVWKTNRPAQGVTIYAGAGPVGGQFSPTRLAARIISSNDDLAAAYRGQYHLYGALPAADGSGWYEEGDGYVLLPEFDSIALVSLNLDSWTSQPGLNQDWALFVDVDWNFLSPQLLALSESGGSAAYSPNALFIQGRFAMSRGHRYHFYLAGRSNPGSDNTNVYLAAGPLSDGTYSTTTISVETTSTAELTTVASAQAQSLGGSNGADWTPLAPSELQVTEQPSVDTTATIGAAVNLWTGTAGYNPDVGVFVSEDGGPPQLVAWKETDGSAADEPDPAFVRATLPMSGGHIYRFLLQWKTNRPAFGVTIYASIASYGLDSPTTLAVQLGGATPTYPPRRPPPAPPFQPTT
jgi:hypothetical protein